jgi:hypothetical protein
MKPYSNFPPAQRRTQQLVEQFNADEQLWRYLERKRRLRRRLLCPHLSATLRTQLGLLDFANARPVQDCVGVLVDTLSSLRPSKVRFRGISRSRRFSC